VKPFPEVKPFLVQAHRPSYSDWVVDSRHATQTEATEAAIRLHSQFKRITRVYDEYTDTVLARWPPAPPPHNRGKKRKKR
jgi:hypothetical protein